MRAWTVDADDIRVAEDFDESLLHRTPEIEAFLTPDREDKFIVIGTKGFGKTLLLKAKRILYQREAQATSMSSRTCRCASGRCHRRSRCACCRQHSPSWRFRCCRWCTA